MKTNTLNHITTGAYYFAPAKILNAKPVLRQYAGQYTGQQGRGQTPRHLHVLPKPQAAAKQVENPGQSFAELLKKHLKASLVNPGSDIGAFGALDNKLPAGDLSPTGDLLFKVESQEAAVSFLVDYWA